MKKSALFMIFITILSLSLSASLLDIYKSGKLKLVPDPNFGKGTAWDIYFPQGILDIAFTKDGSFFATGLGNKACHCVYKFDKNGKFIKKIGRKGRGPGDLYYPGKLSILDNKYLIILENPRVRRISIFDMNGNFVKIIKTKEPVFDVVGLENYKIACLSERYTGKNNLKSSVFILDIKSKTRKLIKTLKGRVRIVKTPETTLIEPSLQDRIFIRKSKKGELIIANNYKNELFLYSPKRGKIKGILLDLPSIKIDNSKIKRYWREEKKYQINKYGKEYISYYKTHKFNGYYKSLFSGIFPLFVNLVMDSEGNILILSYEGHYFLDTPIVRVFSYEGKLLAKTKLSFNIFQPERFDSRVKRIWFFKNYIFASVKDKDDSFELIREKLS